MHRSSLQLFTDFRRALRTKRFDHECSPVFSASFHLPSVLFINIQSKVSFVISARVLLRDLNGDFSIRSVAGCGLCTEVQ